jgi:anti-sigma regulatory factor (Ser/Thr protein kinase)
VTTGSGVDGVGSEPNSDAAPTSAPAPVCLRIPARSASIAVVRLLGSALGRQLDLSDEPIEDLRLAVSEATTYVLSASATARYLEVSLWPAERRLDVLVAPVEVTVAVQAETETADAGPTDAGATDAVGSSGWSMEVLRAVADEVVIERSPAGATVRFGIAVPARDTVA